MQRHVHTYNVYVANYTNFFCNGISMSSNVKDSDHNITSTQKQELPHSKFCVSNVSTKHQISTCPINMRRIHPYQCRQNASIRENTYKTRHWIQNHDQDWKKLYVNKMKNKFGVPK